jgi:aminoglycoside phosphotransferase (APT) family kinase protein
MHEGEVEVTVDVVRRLLAKQYPGLADRPLREGPTTGTVNALFRLGDDLCVRVPRLPAGAASLDKELAWLPRLAPSLPVAVPEPVAAGHPGPGCPLPWAVFRWIDGEAPVPDDLDDEVGLAHDLAAVVAAFRRIDPVGGPASGRGPLAGLDVATRDALAALVPGDGVDRGAAAAAWEQALGAPVWDGAPVWRHGDLLAPNLLLRGGRLAGVVDFGGAGVGDPAHDLLPAWAVFGPTGRAVFREALDVDDGAWTRGLGVALHQALLIIPYYRTTNAGFAALARRTIRETLSDLAL